MKRSTHPVGIRIRGVDYPSISAAARALGVGRWLVVSGLNGGWLDDVGVRPVVPLVRPRRAWVDGVEYPTLEAAAAALGKTERQMLLAGAEGRIQLRVERND